MVTVTVRGTQYSVDEQLLKGAVAAFDVWRDGKGKLSGPLGREAFLGRTAQICLILAPETREDPFRTQRLTRVLRHVLASRPRKAVPS